jgi:hypothetical protein
LEGINPVPKGISPPGISGARQHAADGNQRIFKNIASRYAALIMLIESNPNPTAAVWETFFADNFGPDDASLRDGFLALVASKYEPTRAGIPYFIP